MAGAAAGTSATLRALQADPPGAVLPTVRTPPAAGTLPPRAKTPTGRTKALKNRREHPRPWSSPRPVEPVLNLETRSSITRPPKRAAADSGTPPEETNRTPGVWWYFPHPRLIRRAGSSSP